MSKAMQSSPPLGRGQRSPSEYSLDLDALRLDAQSDVTDSPPKQHVDRLYSEDIDGPSDFTQNMEKWMRGGSMSRNISIISAGNGKGATASQPASKSPGLSRDVPIPEEPPQPEDQFSSEWYPNGQSSTPGPTTLPKLLQPTVEDYHSELPPETQQTGEDERVIADLNRQLHLANSDVQRLKDETKRKDAVIAALREELKTTKQSHSTQLSRSTDDHLRAVELATGLQQQIQDLREQLHEAQTRAPPLPLPSPAPKSTPPPPVPPQDPVLPLLQSQLTALRSDLETRQTELDAANLDRDNAIVDRDSALLERNAALLDRDKALHEHEQLLLERNEAVLDRDAAHDAAADTKTTHADAHVDLAESLRAEIASDNAAVNAAVDAEITSIIKRRDRRWREKLEASERERRFMAKMLMHQWGREEVGTGKPQGYAYKFAKGEKGKE